MAEPTLAQIFGANATQTDSELIVKKAALQTVGLTPSATNTAESLFVAILLTAKPNLTTANQESNPDQSIIIDDQFETLVNRNNQSYRQKTISVALEKLDNSTGINPNDY